MSNSSTATWLPTAVRGNIVEPVSKYTAGVTNCQKLKRGESVVKKFWHDLAWDQFLDWQENGDRRAFKRVCELIIRSCKGHYETTWNLKRF